MVIQAAAPADFRPRAVAAEKIKKSGEGMALELENTTDIAAELGARKREGQILVAFAAETQNVAENARKKLEKKNADLVVANDVTRPGAGFAGDTNAVTIFSRNGRAGSAPARQARGGRGHSRPRGGAVLMYANVIIDRVSDALDHVFTYAVPEGMDAREGQQVCVPLGNTRADGFIVELTDECALEPVARQAHPLPARGGAGHPPGAAGAGQVDAPALQLQPRRGPAPDAARRHAQGRACAKRRAAWRALPTPEPPRAGRDSRRSSSACARAMWRASLLPAAPLRALVAEGRGGNLCAAASAAPPPCCAAETLPDPPLTRAQGRAVTELCAALEHGGGRFLLHGVTGSGKTEVYIRLVRRALELGKSAIVLVPEIALTPQMVAWFHQRFGADAAVLHSGLSQGEHFDEWRRIRSGEARVVIGARSAVFAPLANVGVLVVDEEHEGSYQSDRRPRYDAREVAWQRAQGAGAVLLLGSATPSIASYMRSMPGVRPENRLTLIELPERVGGRPLPEVEVVDMRREFERGNRSIFSARLSEELKDCLGRGRQAMLLINRRGHSSFVSCRKCGYVVKCASCDVSMTYHQAENVLRCHYCGAERAVPQKCPECGSPYIKFFGIGTEQVVEEVQRQFPEATVLRMDYDTTRKKDAHAKILEAFRQGEADILVGTQMIAKGLDFPNVTLSGVVAADMSLNLPDYRSVERTFQLITQMAGRAGRAGLSRQGRFADLRAGSLRHPPGRQPGLSRLLPARKRLSPGRALSALHGDRPHRLYREGGRGREKSGGNGGNGTQRLSRPGRPPPRHRADARPRMPRQAASRRVSLSGVFKNVFQGRYARDHRKDAGAGGCRGGRARGA